MHPSLLNEVYAIRLADRYREADEARRVAAARRRGAPARRPLRAKLGLVLVAVGESLAGPHARRAAVGARTR